QSRIGSDRKRLARVSGHDSVHLPATQNMLCDALVSHRFTRTERQFVNPTDLKDMRAVEARGRAVPGKQLRGIPTDGSPSVLVGHVDRLRPGVRALDHQALAESTLQ